MVLLPMEYFSFFNEVLKEILIWTQVQTQIIVSENEVKLKFCFYLESNTNDTNAFDADGVIGIGIAVSAAGLIAGGIAAALSRKK